MYRDDPFWNLFELRVRPARWYSAWWYRLRGWHGPIQKLVGARHLYEAGAHPGDLYQWVEHSPSVDIAPRRATRVG